jgi:glycosyltransferase involved in cell wall biosynthesis
MQDPIRILAFLLQPYIEYGRIVSGVDRRFLEISSRLKDLGVEVFTLEYAPSLSESWGYSCYHSIELDRLFARSHGVLETIRLIMQGLRACIKFKCNVIYVPGRFLSGRLYIIPPYIVSLLCRKPLVIVFHHLKREDYNKQNPIILLAYLHAKACITVSRATANDIKKKFKVRRLFITGNGVNLHTFKNLKYQAKIYDAIYFGRISEDKGVSTLLQAWKIIIEKLPSAKLLLMGGVPGVNPQYAYRKIVEKLELDQNVTFTGFVSDQQAVSMLNSSKMFVLPSIKEGFGLTVVEAMAAGLPCVLSDLPALKENFRSAAVFVKPRDVEGLAQAILDLLSDAEECGKLIERGRRIVKQFSWETVAEKELEVFKNTINAS